MTLGEFDLLQDCGGDDAFATLAACVTSRTAATGDAIFHAGDESDELFLVRHGVVRVTLSLNGRGYHTLASFGRGNFFGEMTFLVGGARSANAIAMAIACRDRILPHPPHLVRHRPSMVDGSPRPHITRWG